LLKELGKQQITLLLKIVVFRYIFPTKTMAILAPKIAPFCSTLQALDLSIRAMSGDAVGG
jgi:hypothetical protein